MRFAAATTLALVGLISSALAQTKDNALRDIGKVNVIVEDISKDAATCGVTLQNIRDALTARLTGGSLTVVDGAIAKTDPQVATLYVRANIMALAIENVANAPCVTEIAVSLYGYQKVPLLVTKRDVTARVELWEKGTMFATAKEGHGRRVSDAMNQLGQELLTLWTLDNGH